MSAVFVASLLFGAQVVEVTRTRAYLDAGSRSGLSVDQTVDVVRNGKIVGTCRIDSISEHRSSCRSQALLRVGDFVETTTREPTAHHPGQRAQQQPPLTPNSTFPKVVFLREDADQTPDGRLQAEVIGRFGWPGSAEVTGSYSGVEVTARLFDQPIGLWGITADLDLSVLGYLGTSRFRDSPALYVREASLHAHPGTWTLNAGRLRPNVTNIYGLDGALVRHELTPDVRLGGFVGFLPDALRLEPGSVAGGLFFESFHRFENAHRPFDLRTEVAVSAGESNGDVSGALELNARLARGSGFSSWIGLRALGNASTIELGMIDTGLRVELGRRWEVSGQFHQRTASDLTSNQTTGAVVSPNEGTRSLGAGSVAFEPSDALRLGMTGGLTDAGDAHLFGYFGPTLDLRMTENIQGHLGYEESLASGRMGYVATTWSPKSWVVQLRLQGRDEMVADQHDASLGGSLSARLSADEFFASAFLFADQPLREEESPAIMGRVALGLRN